MHMTAATLGLAAATFLASAAAVLALTAVTAVAGVTLIQWVSESVLQLAIGTLLLLFGLQWLRTSILRAGGLATLRDERAAFRAEQEASRLAGLAHP